MADYFEEFITGRPGVVLAYDRDSRPVAVGHDRTVQSIAAAEATLRDASDEKEPS